MSVKPLREQLSDSLISFYSEYDQNSIRSIALENDELAPYFRLMLLCICDKYSSASIKISEEYLKGVVLKKDNEKARLCLESASNALEPIHYLSYGIDYCDENEIEIGHELLLKCFDNMEGLSNDNKGLCCLLLGKTAITLEKQPTERAINFLKLASDSFGNAEAGKVLGDIYSDDKSGFVNEEQAFYYYNKSAQSNNEEAAIEVSKAYYFGLYGVTTDVDKAINILLPFKASENQSVHMILGNLYLQKMIDDESYTSSANFHFSKAYELIKSLNCETSGALDGRLGFVRFMSRESDYIDLFESAIEKGFFDYAYILGDCYYQFGWDKKKAADYYAIAYNHAKLDSYYTLNYYIELLMEENQPYSNYARAYELAEKGINDYNDISFYFYRSKLVMFGLYKGGITVGEAITYMQEIATFDSFEVKANLVLGEYYESYTVNNCSLALTYYNLAFEKGCDMAGLKIARLYEYGKPGITTNTDLAYSWYKKAASVGNKEAKDEMDCFEQNWLGSYKRVREL